MEKRKICLLNDSFPPVIDGVANTVVNYANIIQRDGLGDPFVVTPDYPGKEDESFDFPVLRYPSLNTTQLVHGYRTGIPFSGTLLKRVEYEKPEIIHTHCPAISTVIARELKNHIDAPIIFTYHTKFDVDIAKALRLKLLQKEAVRALVGNVSACDEVWVVSKGAGENLKGLGYEGDVVVMENGVDFPKGRVSNDEAQKVAQDYDLPKEVPMFLFVGRLMWYKGIRIILDALKKLKDSGVEFRMVFIGKGCDQDEMEAYIKECGIERECIFVGPVYDREKLRAWNSRADLFLFPSTYDTNGLVVREAAACGLASVVIQGSCAAEGITDGRNGYFCEENADSMSSVIHQIIQNMDQVHNVGQNAMNEIYVSWEQSVHKATERYEIVLENKKSGAFSDKSFRVTDGVIGATGDVLMAMKQVRLLAFREYFQIKTGLGRGISKNYDMIDSYFQEMRNRVGRLMLRLIRDEGQDIGNQDRYL